MVSNISDVKHLFILWASVPHLTKDCAMYWPAEYASTAYIPAEAYKDWIDWTWQEEFKKPSGLQLKLLANSLNVSKVDKEINEKSYKGREVIPWKGETNFKLSTFIAGDFIIMAVTNERPFYLIEIYNPILAHDLSMIFKEHWDEEQRRNTKS